MLAARGIHVNALRVRGFPFADEIADFVASHPWVFVVEQNRDAQLKTLLVNEGQGQSDAPAVGAALRRHADHRALHRRSDFPARRGAHRGAAEEGVRSIMTYYSPNPSCITRRWPRTRSATRAATTRARSRRCAPAAATTRSRPPSSRRAGNSTSSRTASPSSPASAARRRRRIIFSATRTASTACTAACPRC